MSKISIGYPLLSVYPADKDAALKRREERKKTRAEEHQYKVTRQATSIAAAIAQVKQKQQLNPKKSSQVTWRGALLPENAEILKANGHSIRAEINLFEQHNRTIYRTVISWDDQFEPEDRDESELQQPLYLEQAGQFSSESESKSENRPQYQSSSSNKSDSEQVEKVDSE